MSLASMTLPPIRHLEASYDAEGAIDRIRLRFIATSLGGQEVAYVVAIEPNDGRPYPTEISVVRRVFVGPTITDVAETVLNDRHRGYHTEAEAWAEIEALIKADQRLDHEVVIEA